MTLGGDIERRATDRTLAFTRTQATLPSVRDRARLGPASLIGRQARRRRSPTPTRLSTARLRSSGLGGGLFASRLRAALEEFDSGSAHVPLVLDAMLRVVVPLTREPNEDCQ